MKSWIEYWDSENITSDNIWKKGNTFLYKNTLKSINYRPTDVVMDIGCGKGFFSEIISNKVKKIHLLETSNECLNFCKKKFKRNKNIFYHDLPHNNYLQYDFIKDKVNKIFVISVVQYFNSPTEIKELIKECQKLTVPKDSQMIIADIPINRSILKDTIGLIYNSLKLHTLFDTSLLLLKLIFGNYRKVRQNLKIQVYNLNELQSMLEEMKLDFQILKGITNVRNRISILINF